MVICTDCTKRLAAGDREPTKRKEGDYSPSFLALSIDSVEKSLSVELS